MPSKKSVIKILIFACFACASFVAEENNEIQKLNPESINERNPIQGFYFDTDRWSSFIQSSNLYSYKNKNGLDQLHIGRKPFFESIVPTPLELHRTLFQQISSESALDWRTLGIQPGDQRLHKAKISEIWSGHEVALDVIPVFVNSERRNYAIATFLYRNHPIYFASKQINNLDQLKKHLLSTFTLE